MAKKIIIDMESVSEIDLSKNENDNDGNSMSNLSVVKNVEVSVDNNKLIVEVDLDQDLGKTKRGKTQIATTRGNKFYTLNEDSGLGCALSLTVYKD
jgi:hypothetical protein